MGVHLRRLPEPDLLADCAPASSRRRLLRSIAPTRVGAQSQIVTVGLTLVEGVGLLTLVAHLQLIGVRHTNRDR
jgi:hypothetical protein